jgi:hypothetical protein
MDNGKAAASDWMGGGQDNVSSVAEERSCISAATDANNPVADHVKEVPCNHDSANDDNETNGAASLNTAPQPTTTAATSSTTPIFQYRRSSMMDALSKVANLSSTTTNMIEIARSFDESVASFMMPHTAADHSDGGDEGDNDDDDIDGVDKAIPSLQIVPTFTSSFDSIDDEETAALDDDNSNNDNKGTSMSEDEEEKRYCWTRRRRIVCCIGTIILVIGCVLGIVMTVLFTQMKKHESAAGTVMTLDSVFVDNSSQPDLSAAGVSSTTLIPSGDDGNNQQESLMTTGSSTEVVVSTTTSPTMKLTEESNEPSTAPSNRPSSSSSSQPSTSIHPSISPSTLPSVTPSTSPFALFNYGERLITNYNIGIEISEGLMVRQIAKFGEQVQYVDGNKSNRNFHAWLDGAGVAPLPGGEWVYISNSEDDKGKGGVYGVYFNKYGEVINYKTLLSGTTWNCGGGMTPWNTWVSCEGK